MKSAILLSLTSAVAAHPPVWGWGGPTSACASALATTVAVAPPAYTSGAASSSAPSSAGFKNATYGVSRGGQAVCVDGYIAVSASAQNVKFNYAVPPNETAITDDFLKFVTSGSPFLKSIMAGMQTVSGTYDIRATLCTPKNNTKPSEVQLLTHGVGFDRTYWDFAPDYSYVDIAAEHGYASFFYDRLSVGESEKVDPIQVAQAPLEVEIAHSLAELLRNGSISGDKFSKVIGVGHSYGSIISSAITGLYPSAFDATILTGFSGNSSAIAAFTLGNNFDIASQNDPARFGGLDNAYLVASTIISNQIGFFRLPEFSQAILEAATASKQTVTLGEFFTQGAVGGPAPGYTGPVAVVNGDADLPFCFGNCSYPTNLAAAVGPAVYPTAKTFGTYLAPSTGHGLSLHYTAAAAYEYVQSFLKANGL